MADAEQPHSRSIARTSLAAAARHPSATSHLIGLAWRHSLHPTGPRGTLEARLSLLDSVRLLAVDPAIPPGEFTELVSAAPSPDPADLHAIWAAGAVALRDPNMMRWISAHTDDVAKSANWLSVVPGLAGLTVSVPLAEEALTRLIQHKAKPPKDSSSLIQLNPWFSRRFAARYRRRIGGRRIRVRERGATVRGWSHARTTLGPGVPPEWSSIHGRGVGRPLDRWSHRLLSDYVDRIEDTFETVPPALGSLYAIACGAIDRVAVSPATCNGWNVLPVRVEEAGRHLLGLPPNGDDSSREASALSEASDRLGSDLQAWDRLCSVAFGEGRGITAAAAEVAV